MFINGKILPELYRYTKVSNAASLIRKSDLPKNSILKLDSASLVENTPTLEEIKKAYQTYAASPFVNYYLRTGEAISNSGNRIIECLKEGINLSKGVTGKFIRGITGTRKKPLNDETIADYIFKNKGFTSTSPESESRYANTFALGKNSAVVEFDIKTPMKAFEANNYETIFDTNAFTSEKFGIEKLKDGYYRVFEK